MKKYIIDYTNGSGSGCDQLFDSIEDAQQHMSFWTAEERKGCEIVEVEVEGKFKRLQDVADAYNETDNMVELERDIIASGFISDMDTEWGVAHSDEGRVIVDDNGRAIVL